MLNFEHFIFNKSTVPTNDTERREFYARLEEQFYTEINASEAARNYFAKYDPIHVDSFIKSYASRKAHLTQCYEYYFNAYHKKEIAELDFQKLAEKMIHLILQKKLFNMQLLWRAGKLEIEGVDICYDFQFWERFIITCPFIPPVTEFELDIMKDFLSDPGTTDESIELDMHTRQDYEWIIEKDSRGLTENMPEWYDFYDMRMGTSSLLLLPDIRGNKEEFYLELARNEQKRKNPSLYNSSATYNQQPMLMGFGKDLFEFSEVFESDKYFKALFKYNNYLSEKDRKYPNTDDINEAIELLFDADRPVYFSSHLNWDEAIMDAAKQYRNTKIFEALGFAWEEYRLMKELGISKFETPEEIRKRHKKDDIVQLYRTKILEGRVLNGDPADFNY